MLNLGKGKVSENIPRAKECFIDDGTQLFERAQSTKGLGQTSVYGIFICFICYIEKF